VLQAAVTIHDMLQSPFVVAQDTIAAISTAPGVGAIAVVRLSGSRSFEIASRIFSPAAGGQDGTLLESHRCSFGQIKDPATGTIIDEVILIPYKGPRTYTGEDLVEINCHGGWLAPNEILSLLLRQGARLAGPGEFTQRAFLCGRIDLTQAEAVLDLIQAKTSRQGQVAVSALSGALGSEIRQIRSRLIDLLSEVVAAIDFPDEVAEASSRHVEEVVAGCRARLAGLSGTARSGRFLREGLRLAIVGRPNAGKSSLLNQLLKFERAIVTDIPGTTRDSLEELHEINGIPVLLIDTAGVRHTEDRVERAGIERTIAAIKQAELVLFVVDLACGWQDPEEEIRGHIGERSFILVGNKVDRLAPESAAAILPARADAAATLYVSAATGAGIEELTAAIERFVFAGQAAAGQGASLNARQAELCRRAAEALSLVGETLAGGLPADCLATDLKAAVDALSEICGEAVSEEVIGRVFANFCVGK